MRSRSAIPGAAGQLAALAAALAMSGALQAAPDWTEVAGAGRDGVAIDRSSIALGGAESTAWSRVRLGQAVRDNSGNYDSIHAQNRYDCGARRFTTVQRAYYLGEKRIRVEAVSRPRSHAAQPGSLDARLLDLACGASTAAPTPDSGRPQAMHADLRKLDEGETARAFPVADAGTEKPRLIQLPAIDKAAAAAAAVEAAQKAGEAGQKASQGSGDKNNAKAAKSPPAAPAPARAQAAKDPASRAAIPRDRAEVDERRLRELMYARSGPARAAKRKAPATEEAHRADAHWSYEGETGPAHWARLNPAWGSCAGGRRQSPIDIRDGIRVDLETIRFDYKPAAFRIVDLGHTVQVNVAEGASLTVTGKRYALLQFHLHRPAEERVNGRSYDLGLHFVHRNDEGQLAVLAVLLERGADNPLLQTLLNNLPLEQNVEVAPEAVLDLVRLLPEDRAYWTYMGSLTTPPCSEGVLWMVLKQTLPVGPEQLAILTRVLRSNARPLQAGHGRLIKESR